MIGTLPGGWYHNWYIAWWVVSWLVHCLVVGIMIGTLRGGWYHNWYTAWWEVSWLVHCVVGGIMIGTLPGGWVQWTDWLTHSGEASHETVLDETEPLRWATMCLRPLLLVVVVVGDGDLP